MITSVKVEPGCFVTRDAINTCPILLSTCVLKTEFGVHACKYYDTKTKKCKEGFIPKQQEWVQDDSEDSEDK